MSVQYPLSDAERCRNWPVKRKSDALVDHRPANRLRVRVDGRTSNEAQEMELRSVGCQATLASGSAGPKPWQDDRGAKGSLWPTATINDEPVASDCAGDIAGQLERLHKRTPRGSAKWLASSVLSIEPAGLVSSPNRPQPDQRPSDVFLLRDSHQFMMRG